MRAIRWSLILSLLLTAGATAQKYDSPRGEEAKPIPQELPDDFYPSKTMVQMFLEKFAENFGDQLELDEQQVEIMREKFYDEIPRYLAEHRPKIQPAINDFLRMWNEKEAPTSERVAEWAERTMPILNDFTGNFRGVSDSLREHLTDEQNVRLDGMQAAFDVGNRFMNERLANWADGGFDRDTDWHRTPGHEQAERERQEMINAEVEYQKKVAQGIEAVPPPHLGGPAADSDAAGGPTVNAGVANTGGEARPLGNAPTAIVAAQKDEWTVYVEQFCERYQLNNEQRSRATQFLAQAKDQKSQWEAKKAPDMRRLEGMIAKAANEAQKKDYTTKLDRLKEPFNRQFSQLKERLEKLPTARQRSEAAERATPPAAGGGGAPQVTAKPGTP